MAKRKASKKEKTISAAELKTWLRGVEAFQTAAWTPNAEQWATIKEQIFALEELVPTVEVSNTANTTSTAAATSQPATPAPVPVKKVGPSFLGTPPADDVVDDGYIPPVGSPGNVKPTETGVVQVSPPPEGANPASQFS